MEKMDFRELSSQERYVIRKRAVKLIEAGEKQVFIAKLFGVRTATVSEWVKLFKSQGISGLKDNKRGVNSESKKLISKQQEKLIQNMILDTMPDQLKLPYAL